MMLRGIGSGTLPDMPNAGPSPIPAAGCAQINAIAQSGVLLTSDQAGTLSLCVQQGTISSAPVSTDPPGQFCITLPFSDGKNCFPTTYLYIGGAALLLLLVMKK